MTKSGLAFIYTHLEVQGDLPLELIPEHTLRRATSREVELIQVRLDTCNVEVGFRLQSPYQHQIEEQKMQNGISYHFHKLPPDQWKYWVIAFEGTNWSLRQIEYAGILMPNELDLAFTLLFSEAHQQGDLIGWSGIPLHLADQYKDMSATTKAATKMYASEFQIMRMLLDQLSQLPEEAAFIRHALDNFFAVRSIPTKSDLRVVGYFAIIESLITHAPRLTETLDSINHQIVNKLILLRKRFSRPISYLTFFDEFGEEKLWKLLYSYRSSLAHGGKVDFATTYKILKSNGNVTRFLREIIKELIVFGLKEYIFLADLKKC